MKEIYEGLKILIEYGKGNFSAEHDKIWAGREGIIEDMTTYHIDRMKKFNWFIDEEFDCWCHFC